MDFTLALPITAAAAILNGALLILMTVSIALHRRSNQISFGDGDDNRFAKRLRGHANATEQIPISLILLGLAEGMNAAVPALWAVAVLLTAGRYFHAIQFWKKGAPIVLRSTGMRMTILAQAMAIVIIAVKLIL